MAFLQKKNSILIYASFGFILVILFVLLMYLNKPTVSEKPAESKKPEIIIVNNTKDVSASGRDSIPHYPSNLPRYGSSQYQQVGILTSEEADKEPIVLPLFGRKLENRSDRWQYYTATDKNNMMRIPLMYQNRECEDEVGCSEIYTGDTLQISIYQGRTFTATIYRTEAPRYFSSQY